MRYRKVQEKTKLLNVDEMKAIVGQQLSVSVIEHVNCVVMCHALSVFGVITVAETKAFVDQSKEKSGGQETRRERGTDTACAAKERTRLGAMQGVGRRIRSHGAIRNVIRFEAIH